MAPSDSIILTADVPRVQFACDLTACKGACCTMPGGRGAPLLENELTELEQAFPVVKKYLSSTSLETIKQFGIYEGTSGDHVTTCIDHRACVFVVFEGGIAKCAIEKAYFAGEVGWRKPLSCHLFPIRIDRMFGNRVRYEHIDECRPALANGKKNNIWLSDFLKDALTRSFGEQWYSRFKEQCDHEREL